MTRKEIERIVRQEQVLVSLGFTTEEAYKLRRISMTLQRWFEHECNGEIQRDEVSRKPYYDFCIPGEGRTRSSHPIADREKGALKRLEKIVARVNSERNESDGDISSYIQRDPRGAALYIIRPGDVPAGANVDSYYSRGICVY